MRVKLNPILGISRRSFSCNISAIFREIFDNAASVAYAKKKKEKRKYQVSWQFMCICINIWHFVGRETIADCRLKTANLTNECRLPEADAKKQSLAPKHKNRGSCHTQRKREREKRKELCRVVQKQKLKHETSRRACSKKKPCTFNGKVE